MRTGLTCGGIERLWAADANVAPGTNHAIAADNGWPTIRPGFKAEYFILKTAEEDQALDKDPFESRMPMISRRTHSSCSTTGTVEGAWVNRVMNRREWI